MITTLRRMMRAEGGAVALIFVLALVPILAFVAAAIDYSRATTVRARLQTALDSAVLAAAVKQGTNEERLTAFQGAFTSHVFGSEATGASAVADLSTPGYVNGTASAKVGTSFFGVLGVPSLDVAVRSEGRMGGGGAEIVMGLDVSGSMSAWDMSGRSRIEVMREAAGDLIDAAVAEATTPGKLKFGFVPFQMTVNIGMANVGYVDGANDPLFTGTSWAGCVLERAPPNHVSNNYTPLTKFRAYAYPPETDSDACGNAGANSNTAYKYLDPLLPLSVSYDANTRGPNYNCVRFPMEPLTTDAAAVKAKIGALDSPGNMGTLLAPPVTWGMRLLTPNAPFPGADPFTAGTRKVLVVLTDGSQTTEIRSPNCSNTQNAAGAAYRFDPASMGLGGRVIGPNGPRDYFSPYGYLYDSDPFNRNYPSFFDVDPSLDALALEACNRAKQLGIEIYTVAVSSAAGPGTSVHDTLLACASDPSHFYYATDAATLKTAFATIGRTSAKFVRTR